MLSIADVLFQDLNIAWKTGVSLLQRKKRQLEARTRL